MESALTTKSAATSSITSDFITSRMLRGRLGQPEELVGAAIFLASGASSLVNGHTLMCDDGYLVA
jgi:gluconate 5-dehydrogenase